MAKKRIFVSFDFDNDKILKDFIIGQSKLPDSPFEIIDVSLKEAAPERDWAERAEWKIRNCDMVVVMLGPYTHRAPGVLREIAMALNWRKPIVQIIGYKDGNYTPVPHIGQPYPWNWDNLKMLFR